MVKIKPCKKIQTGDKGWLLEIASDKDGFTDIKGQIYLITVNPGDTKGYHYYRETDYYVTCIKGIVIHTVYDSSGKKTETLMGENNFQTVFMPKGSAHALENVSKEVAYVLMYRTVSWFPGDNEQLDILPKDIDRDRKSTRLNSSH